MPLTNFTAASFKKSGGASKKTAAKKTAAKAAKKDEVPEGTSQEIQDWVGDDPKKAQRALDVENKDDNPRVTLVDALEKLIDADDDKDDDGDDKKTAAKKTAAKKS